jgi:hypothetical protein
MMPLALILSTPGRAAADDANGGTVGDAEFDGGTPLACDGALCDTTNGGTCSTAGRPIGRAHTDSTSFACLLSAGALCSVRRRLTGTPRPMPKRRCEPDRPVAPGHSKHRSR